MRQLQKMYRQLRVKDVVIIFFATVAVLHVLFELTIYQDRPTHENLAKSLRASSGSEERSTAAPAKRKMTSSGLFPPLPDKAAEEKRYVNQLQQKA